MVMAFEFTTDTMNILMFMRRFMPFPASEKMEGIGLLRDGEMVAGVMFENFNGTSVWMHVAAIPGKRWMTKSYLKRCFEYPFIHLGAKAIFGWVRADNVEARRFDEHLGFKEHAHIAGAGFNGKDVVVYRMNREDCRYVDPQ